MAAVINLKAVVVAGTGKVPVLTEAAERRNLAGFEVSDITGLDSLKVGLGLFPN